MKGATGKATRVVLAVAVAGVAVAVTTGAQAKKSANIQVCVLLPDTKSSVRWVQFDAPYFKAALKKAGVTYSITNALNDPQKMVSQADSCLSRGAKVAIVTDIAQGTSIAIDEPWAMSVTMATFAPRDRHESACETIFCGSFSAFVIE